MTGTTVGHYEIQEKLGEGGMGMVYKARDLLLNRTAALKFLPADSAGLDDKRRRFIQEAQAASALNHPNIITIYEVGQADERDFIAMELVQGHPLDEEIARKALPVGKAVTYSIQVADALAAAHAAGIVHRDLKPANVMVADSGLVKVLDFGLAKIVIAASSPSDATRTMLAAKTADGAILGTVSYMSPEQAEGKPVDHRSDIFSFGALLYEMLTGRRAFQGESAVSTLAAILTAEPAPLSTEASALPGELARIVARCLRKAPERRWQSIADVRIALEEFKQDLDSGKLAAEQAPAQTGRARRPWISIAAAALIAAAVAGFAAWRAHPAAPESELWRVRRLTADSGASLHPTISPDGKLVAYASDRAAGDAVDLWVQQVEGGDPVRLTRGLGFCSGASFSPDGSRIAVRCGTELGHIYLVPTFGGLPKKLADGESPQFSPDGSRIAYLASSSGSPTSRSVWIVPADGGTAKEIKVDKGFNGGPVWTPDGKGLLFNGFGDPQNGRDERDWFLLPADGGAPAPTGARQRLEAAGLGIGRDLTLLPGGMLFADGNLESTNIYRLPFDGKFQKPSGNPAPLIIGAGFSFSPAASQDGRRIAFAVGTNLSTNIWRAAIDPGTGKGVGEPVRVTSGVDPSRSPSPSRDGKRVAYLGGPFKASEVRIHDIATGKDVRLAAAKEWSLVALSTDGSTVAFNSDERNNGPIYSVPAEGGIPKKICGACGRPVEWSADKSKVLFDNAGPQRRDIHILDVASGQSKALLQHAESQLTMPRVSPDGRLIAFSMVRPGRARRLYLAPFTGEAVPEKDWTVVLDAIDLDRQPFWGPAGNLIYFTSDRDGSRCIWAQRVDPATRQAAGSAFAVQHMHQITRNLMDIGDAASVGLSVAGGQMFFASFELQSNVWLAERRQAAQK